ncbi:MAG: PAS domain-containing protein [Bacteroidota bacterium]
MNFIKELPYAVTVCDRDGKILEMNDKSVETFNKYGGKELIGKSLLDCHHKKAQKTLVDMLKNHDTNAYTIEKEGVKKLIYQSPWFEDGKFAGYIELSLILPTDMPHFIRK